MAGRRSDPAQRGICNGHFVLYLCVLHLPLLSGGLEMGIEQLHFGTEFGLALRQFVLDLLVIGIVQVDFVRGWWAEPPPLSQPCPP